MLVPLLLTLFASADPAFIPADEDIACYVEFTGVVPFAGATDVPIDTIIRAVPSGEACGAQDLTFTLTEGETVLEPVVVSFEVGVWVSFPEVELKPSTDYQASFYTDMGQLDIAFTTGTQESPAPLAPDFELDDLLAEEYGDRIGIYMSAPFYADTKDPSGLSTVRVTLENRLDRSFSSGTGMVDDAVHWVEDDVPAEVCLSAVTANPAGVESEPTIACAEPDYTLYPSLEGNGQGCNCSSTGSAGWLVLGLVPALLFRRRSA